MEQYITMGLNILLLVFITLGFLFGIIRGLRKTAARGIFLIITAIIALFITIPITDLLLGIKFDANISLNGETLSDKLNIYEIITIFIENFIGADFIESNPKSVQLILTVPVMIIHVIMYMLIFIVLKYLLLPINYLFYRLTFAPRKRTAFGFSAFDNDPNDINNIFTPNSNSSTDSNVFEENSTLTPFDLFTQNNSIEQSNNTSDSNTTPLSSNNPFDFSAQNEQTSLKSIDTAEKISNDEAPLDNSIFETHSEINDVGKFITKEPNHEEQSNEPVFNVAMSSNEVTETPKKEKKKKKEKVKIKKYRLWGGVVGILVGLFIMSNILLPVYGTLNILSELNKVKLNNISEKEISLDSLTNGFSTEILDGYDSSVLKYISTYTGLEGLSLAEFDYLTTQTIGENKLTLRKDIQTIVETTKKVDALIGKFKGFSGDGDYSSLTKEQIKILLEDSKTLMSDIKNIKLIDTSTNFILPMTCSILLNSSMQISNNSEIDDMIIELITALKDESINVFDEFNAIVEVAEYLNEKNVLTKILNSDYSEPIEIINSFDSEFTNKLFKLKTISVTIPHVINISLALLDQNLQFGFVENNADATTIKNAISNFIDTTLAFAKTIDTDSSIYITNESLVPLGKALQVAKASGLLNDDTYANLVDFSINKLQNIITDITPDIFDDYVKNELLVNIAKVDNWEYEMSIINDGILKLRDIDNGILGDVEEGKNIRQGINLHFDMTEGVFINLGKAFDILEESCIFGARTYKDEHQISGIVSLMTNILEFADESIKDEFDSNSEMQNITTIISEMKTNIINSNHTYSKDNPFWEPELTQISPLIVNIYDMFNAENFDFDSKLGKNLDKAKYSTMLGNNTTLTLMGVALDVVEDQILESDYEYNDGTNLSSPQDINDKIYEMFDEIQTNLKTNATKREVLTDANFWEKEIGYYSSLKNIADKSTQLTEISEAVELSEDLDNIYKSYTIPRQNINNIIAFALKDVKYTGLTTSDKVKLAINETIDDIAEKLENETFLDDKELKDFWTIEFNHIKNMTDIKFNDETGYSVKNNLSNIGKELDKVCLGYIVTDDPNTTENEAKTIRSSYLISHANLRNILGNAIEEMSTTLTNSFDTDVKEIISTALNDIKTNVFDIANIPSISFEFELSKLKTLSNLELSSDLVKYPAGTDSEIQNQLNENKQALQSLGLTLDEISFNNTFDVNKYAYTEANNSKIITRQIINNLIIDMFDLGNVTINGYDEDNVITKKNAFNTLIERIQSEILNHSNRDHIISWQRELGFINTLITLNKDITYTIDNAGSEIGTNVDTIAFNLATDGTQTFYNDIMFDSDDCVYIPDQTITIGNSLFVTREAILTTLEAFVGTIKSDTSEIADPLEKEEKEIVNAIIDNITDTVATNEIELYSGKKYPNMSITFEQLQIVNSNINTLVENVDNQNIESLNNNQQLGTLIDNALDEFERAPICGIQVTRRMAKLILNHIDIPTSPIDLTQTEAGLYHQSLLTMFTNNLSNATTTYEEYKTNKYFETMFSKSIIPNP